MYVEFFEISAAGGKRHVVSVDMDYIPQRGDTVLVDGKFGAPDRFFTAENVAIRIEPSAQVSYAVTFKNYEEE